MRVTLGLLLVLGGCGRVTGWVRGPAVSDLIVQPGTCGQWTAQATVRAEGIVQVVVGETVVLAEPVRGTQRISARGDLEPGTSAELRVVLPDGTSERTAVAVASMSGAVRVADQRGPIDASNRLRVEVDPGCVGGRAAGELQVEVSVGGDTVREVVRGPEVSIALPVLAVGTHPIVARLRVDDLLLGEARATWTMTGPCLDGDGDGYTTCLGDCDDARADVRPGVAEVRGDGVDNDCDGVNGLDADGDGHEAASVGGKDCDDSNPAVFPGAPEFVDADQDGFGSPDGLDNDCNRKVDDNPPLQLDCDDNVAEVNPGRAEVTTPNQRDDDCDGKVDEGTVAFDDDGDGLAELQGDCDDRDAKVLPGAAEQGNCRDDNCDGQVDEGVEVPERDDGFESNDTVNQVHDLGTKGQLRFSQRLHLVSRGLQDQEWFRFWSDDGPFDDWSIVARVEQQGVDTVYELTVRDDAGGARGSAVFDGHATEVRVSGRAFVPDSGNYTLEVVPKRLPRSWCPVVVYLESW